jgi:phospholipid transport system substrate-binding protein
MRMRTLLIICTLAAASLLVRPAVQPASAIEATSPEKAAQFIKDIGGRTINALANQQTSQADREAKVRALLREGLDLPTIGRFVLGRSWQTASPAQRDEYAKVVADYVLYTYAHRLAAYSGETFKVNNAQPIADTDAIVLTTVQRPSGEPANVSWRVRASEAGYKVIDVVVEGVSMVVTQRQEFASVVQRKGLDGLLDSLRDQTRQLAAGRAVGTSQ